MKLACCTGIENAAVLARCGVKYIELSAAGIAQMPPEEINTAICRLQDAGLQCRSVNMLISGEVPPLYQPEALSVAEEYCARLFERLERFGVETVVFGSGGFRRFPEDVPEEARSEKLLALLSMLSRKASPHGISIAIEPLNGAESNTINTLKQALGLVRQLGQPNIKALVDLYHLVVEQEPMENILSAGDGLLHVHIARPEGRIFPKANDGYDYAPFFKILRDIAYDGIVSIEGSAADLEADLQASVSFLRNWIKE